MKKNILIALFLTVSIYAGELEVEGDLKVQGNVVFQDDTSINTAPTSLPPGAIIPFAGTTAPNGWLLCFGQEISRDTYSDLFSVISNTYGIGDGTTTFNLPDLRGRMVIGIDNMGGDSANRVENEQADVLGGSAGEENHTLTVDELASHNHSIVGRTQTSSNQYISFAAVSNAQYASTTTEYTGGNESHNNMPPYISLNYIIKF